MSASVNKVILVGHLGKDPEVRALTSGGKVATLRMATSETWKDKGTGEKKERTEWHNVVIFNDGLVGVAEQYLKKGSKVYVEGMLATRKWTDQAGQERYTTEVVLKAYRGELVLLDRAERPPPAEDSYGQTKPRPAGGSLAQDLDDDIPF